MKRLAVMVVAGLGFFALSGTASAQTGSDQLFIVFGSGSDGDESSTVIAVGPITSVGTFEETEDEDVVRFVFPEGTITLDAPTEEESEEFDERTCSGSFSFSGPFEIIDATGEFSGATGSGRFEGQGRFFGELGPEGCSEEGGFFFFFFVTVEGDVTLPAEAAA